DHLLAMRRGQRRHAEVDGDTVHRDASASVLWAEAVSDIEARENFDARHERRPDRARQRSRMGKHAVDTVAHCDALLFRLDVDVARARSNAAGNELVDECRDGRAAVVSVGRWCGLLAVVEMLDV